MKTERRMVGRNGEHRGKLTGRNDGEHERKVKRGWRFEDWRWQRIEEESCEGEEIGRAGGEKQSWRISAHVENEQTSWVKKETLQERGKTNIWITRMSRRKRRVIATSLHMITTKLAICHDLKHIRKHVRADTKWFDNSSAYLRSVLTFNFTCGLQCVIPADMC